MQSNWNEGHLRISISPTIKCGSREGQLFILQSNQEDIRERRKGKWVEVMPSTVWSHNSTMCRATNFTSFRLMYEAEAVLP
jgi:hypothetical protein